MVSKVYSVSMPEDLKMFVDEDPDLNLSNIIQSAIREIMERRNTDPLIQRLRKQNTALQKALEEAQK